MEGKLPSVLNENIFVSFLSCDVRGFISVVDIEIKLKYGAK